MKKTILVAIIGAMTLGLNAGDWGKAPVGKAPIEECVDLGGSVNAGYQSDYYFKGVHVAEDSVWANINYTFDGLAVPVTVGTTYINGFQPVFYDQIDLNLSAEVGTFFGFDTNLGFAYHFFPEFINNRLNFGEVTLDARRSLGFVDLVFGTSYMLGSQTDFNEGWYHHFGLEKSFALTDSIELILAAGAGYLDSPVLFLPTAIQEFNSTWNHYYVRASFPIELNCRATLTPYVEYFSRDDDIRGFQINGFARNDNNVSAGVSLNVAF